MAAKSRQSLPMDGLGLHTSHKAQAKFDKAKKLLEDKADREAKECTFKP